MIIFFEFASNFSSILGKKRFEVYLSKENVNVNDAVIELQLQYPLLAKVFRDHKIIKGGSLDAILICDQTILKENSTLLDQALIKVISPISGG